MRPLAVTALVLVLLAATAAAFGVAERLKLGRSPVTAPRFDRSLAPTCGCESARARLSLTLRRPDTVDASIVDAAGKHVRLLVERSARRRGRTTFVWDGRDDRGQVAPDGLYRLRIALERSDRTIVVPTPIRVDGKPPRIALVSAAPRTFSPDGDGRADRVLFTYRASEGSYPVVRVGGRIVVRGKLRPAGPGRVRWRGRIEGRFAAPGVYRTSLEAVDAAGNRSEPTPAVSLRVRYIEVVRPRLRVRAGGVLRLPVETDAASYRWQLVRKRGRLPSGEGAVRARDGSVRVPRALAPGRYLLRVAIPGHADVAEVVITARNPPRFRRAR